MMKKINAEQIYPNVNGKAYAINVLTPNKFWTTTIQKLVFWAVGKFPATQSRLIDLSFIHFARWVIITKNQFPYLGHGQPKEDLAYDYLLFHSNFNGSWGQYIDAFSDVLPDGLNTIWNWSAAFPGARPGLNFKRYIRANQFDTEHYYNAYPGAAINDVKAAKNVSQNVLVLAGKATKMSPTEFQTAYNKMLLKIQGDLGATGPGPVPATN